MQRVCELDVYKLAEALADMAWHDFDRKVNSRWQWIIQMRAFGP
jgi:hypothetical protein